MDIEKLLNGTEFQNLIPKFHGEGIATLDDLRTLHRNGKMFDVLTKITSTPTDAIKLKKLIQSEFNKVGVYFAVGFFVLLLIIFLSIF
tara:strand:+ start:636 stop:899 length:264 start_codon:yes stop_codon:yes gene_type:complete